MDETYRGYLVAALAALLLDAVLLFAIVLYLRTFWQRRYWGFVKGIIVEVGPGLNESVTSTVTYEYVVDGKTYRVGPIGGSRDVGEEIEVTYRKDTSYLLCVQPPVKPGFKIRKIRQRGTQWDRNLL